MHPATQLIQNYIILIADSILQILKSNMLNSCVKKFRNKFD